MPNIFDDFNNGVLCSIWEPFSTNNARVYEANGVLSIYIGEGTRPDGGNQVAGIYSRDFILKGDFDVQVDFELATNYHSIPEANTKLILLDRNGYGLEISVRRGAYLSKEVFPGGTGIEQLWTPTEDLLGKLRITRVGEQVTTYFWDNGWQKHAQWQPQFVSGDLRINLDAWNWRPYFLSFTVNFDNLLVYNSTTVSCSSP